MLRFHSRSSAAAFTAAALLLVVGAPACNDTDGACTAEPVGAIMAYDVATSPATHMEIEGSVVSLSPVRESGLQELVIQGTGTSGPDTLRYGIWGLPDRVVPLPLAPGRSFRILLDHVGGHPEASGLLIQDDDGVLFAAASDRGLGELALTGGVPGFSLALEAADCSSRETDDCYAAIRNMRLRVTRGEDSVSIHHGEEAILAGYRVVCLTAQDVEYTNACADAGLTHISYVIARADSTD